MKRLLLLSLAVIVIAGLLGTLVAQDPGYALLAYGDFAMQTSLWVMLCLLLLFWLLLHWLAGLYRAMRGLSGGFAAWREGRRESRASRLKERGVRRLLEGDYSQARRQLDSGADDGFTKGVNYLAAARAADADGDAGARESYLRLAVESEPALARARQVVAAELALQRGEAAACLEALAGLEANPHIEALRQQALLQSGDWRGLLALARKRRGQAGLAAEKQAALAGMAALAGDDQGLEALFGSLKKDNRQDADLLLAFGGGLRASAAAEAPIRAALRQAWDSRLVRLYGQLPGESAGSRLQQAQAWLKAHEDDADLHATLARLYQQAEQPEQALTHAERSLALAPSADTHSLLAALLEGSGDLPGSHQHLKQALSA